MALEAPGHRSAMAAGVVNRGHPGGFRVILGVAVSLMAFSPGTSRSHMPNNGRVV